MEFDDAKSEYRVNLLGVRQLKRELELLNEMLETSYKQVFAKYATVLAEETVPYCFDSVVDWINAHLNQPMLKEEMYESIMALKVFKEYKGRPMGQDALNRKLQIYGVEIITVREFKRNENRNKTFWKMIRIWYDFGAKIVLALYRIGTKNEPNLDNRIEKNNRLMIYL